MDGYQRGRIQGRVAAVRVAQHDGSLPIVGVNMFRPPRGRAGHRRGRTHAGDRSGEGVAAAASRRLPHARHADDAPPALERLRRVAAEAATHTLRGAHGRRSGVLLRQINAGVLRGGWPVPEEHVTGPLPFDPVARPPRHWREHGWADAAPGMAAVTALMRAQQIMQARVDAEGCAARDDVRAVRGAHAVALLGPWPTADAGDRRPTRCTRPASRMPWIDSKRRSGPADAAPR